MLDRKLDMVAGDGRGGRKGMELAGRTDLSLAFYDDIGDRCGFRIRTRSKRDARPLYRKRIECYRDGPQSSVSCYQQAVQVSPANQL